MTEDEARMNLYWPARDLLNEYIEGGFESIGTNSEIISLVIQSVTVFVVYLLVNRRTH